MSSVLSQEYGACFDLYSTLIHEDPGNPFYADVATRLELDLDLWLAAYRKRGRDSMAGRLPGMSDRVKAALEDAGYTRDRMAVERAVAEAFPRFAASVRLDAQAADTLWTLRVAGLRLALVSNASSYSEGIIDRSGLRDCFDSVVLSYRVAVLKPDPAIYRIALDDLGLPGSACAFIGDGGDCELRGARQAGMRTVLVDRGLPHTREAAADADVVISDLAEVPGLLAATRFTALRPTRLQEGLRQHGFHPARDR